MFGIALCILLAVTASSCASEQSNPRDIPFTREKYYHNPGRLTDKQVATLSDLTNVTHMNEILDNICVVRIVGTPEHVRVREYIKRSMRDVGWTVESDIFEDDTPIFGKLEFENIIAKLNPNANRYLALACHFDSKYTRERDFVGATDSAVPCAQMINLATVMTKYLPKQQDISLMFIFFDGEEAFEEWGPKDSIYGSRHLAQMWHKNKTTYGRENFSELDKIDILVLLDLLGAPDPTFYNYFEDTEKWYTFLVHTEKKLAAMRKLESYTYGKQKYFQPFSYQAHIEDDHIPFLIKNVPILHLIPIPFPSFWHKPSDNRHNIDMKTTENINKILRMFVASYLHLSIP